MTSASKLLGIALLCVAGFLSAASTARSDIIYVYADTYAAIAYSPATGKWGYGYNYGSRYAAETAALNNCPAADARIVTWVCNGFCSLALGNDQSCWGVGYSWGNGASSGEANGNALDECEARTTGAHIVLCVCSDNVTPYVAR